MKQLLEAHELCDHGRFAPGAADARQHAATLSEQAIAALEAKPLKRAEAAAGGVA